MPSLRVGVIYEETQLSDLIGIDIIGNMGKELMSAMADFGYSHLVPRAYEVEFLYISSTLSPARSTPNVQIMPTHTYDTAPRDLDMLVVGGPLPSHRPEASLNFFREAVLQTRVIFSVCTGSMWLASSGILHGLKATTNRFFLPMANQLHPDVEWLDQRWVVSQSDPGHAQLWIAGAADCGIEMIATYALQNLDPEVAQVACEAIGFNPQNPQHGQFYSDASSKSSALKI